MCVAAMIAAFCGVKRSDAISTPMKIVAVQAIPIGGL